MNPRYPQSGLSQRIARIKDRTSARMAGSTHFPRRVFHVQNRRNPLRCQSITVAGLTMMELGCQSAQAADNHAKKNDQRRSTSAASTTVAEHRADDEGPKSQAEVSFAGEREPGKPPPAPPTETNNGIEGRKATPLFQQLRALRERQFVDDQRLHCRRRYKTRAAKAEGVSNNVAGSGIGATGGPVGAKTLNCRGTSIVRP